MRRALPLLFLLVFAAACTTGPQLSDDCAANALCAARAAEPPLILAAKDLAERKGDDLFLKPRNAPPITFTDHKAACDTGDADRCDGFAFMGAFPKPGALVVQQFFYEGSNFIFIDQDSGKRIRLAAMPVFSPDGQRFLVAPYDLENDIGPNNLEIWRREGDGAVLEWAHTLAQTHAEDPSLPLPYQVKVQSWSGDRIKLSLFTDVPEKRRWRGTLVRSADGWQLSAQSPPGTFPPEQPGS
ncbi:MAG: hypothetical protein J0I19_13555 [Alphaproteobacteria bacterium]|nr:hypothetical protein [Alphaproteobacteria bacterium]